MDSLLASGRARICTPALLTLFLEGEPKHLASAEKSFQSTWSRQKGSQGKGWRCGCLSSHSLLSPGTQYRQTSGRHHGPGVVK